MSIGSRRPRPLVEDGVARPHEHRRRRGVFVSAVEDQTQIAGNRARLAEKGILLA